MTPAAPQNAALLNSLLLALSARRLRAGPNMGTWSIT
jgi:hypothetical protein